MSRIGKHPIPVPAGVEVTINGNHINVKGPKGELDYNFCEILNVELAEGVVTVTRPDDSRQATRMHGLTRTLIANMVEGVSKGYEKKLELVGVGYRAAIKGSNLEMQLGFSHPVIVEPPAGITFTCPDATHIVVSGYDKQLVGETAACIRKWRKPEPDKGKGIRYEGEVGRRKLGKSGKGDK